MTSIFIRIFLLRYRLWGNSSCEVLWQPRIYRGLKNEEKNKLKKSAEVLNECFDLKNKNQRSLNDSMKLIEYCLEEYGSEKKFN